jgi:hypothetical protein
LYPTRNADTEHFAYPLATASYESLETDGCASLIINPSFLDEAKLKKGSAEARAREMVAHPNYSSPTGEANLHLPANAGKKLDDFVQNNHLEDNPKLPAGRWKNFPGV